MHAEKSLEEIGMQLPNGFHDSTLDAITLDLVANTARMEFSIDVCDYPQPNLYRKAVLLLRDLVYFVIEPPGPGSEWTDGDGAWITSDDEASEEAESHQLRPRIPVPSGAFAHHFFVTDWNAFLHVAARSADFEWTEEEPKARAES